MTELATTASAWEGDTSQNPHHCPVTCTRTVSHHSSLDRLWGQDFKTWVSQPRPWYYTHTPLHRKLKHFQKRTQGDFFNYLKS